MTDQLSETANEGQGGAGAPAEGGTAPSSQPAPWYAAAAGFTDEDKAYIETKGWRGPENVYKSYRDLERVMGDKASAVLLPKPSDPEGHVNFLREHMGSPADVDGYKMPELPDDQRFISDASFDFLRQTAHAVGATPQQFENYVKLYNEALGEAQEADVERFNGEVDQVKRKLEHEMGQEYGEHVAQGNLAMRKLGISPDEMTQVSEALGIERATRLLMSIGGALKQDAPVGMNGQGTQGGFITDKARAAEQISRIQRGDDPNFKKALLDAGHPDHANVSNQWRAWQQAANS